MSTVEVRPLTSARWDDLVEVFGRRGDDPGWCWCRRFLGPPPDGTDGSDGRPDHRTALHREVADATVPPGLLAFVDGRPVGWTRVGPRDELPGVRGNRALARLLEPAPGAWWITCCFVAPSARGSGVGTALVRAATRFALDHGAECVEGHPVDVSALKNTSPAASAVFTGTMAMFSAAGFSEVGRTFPSRPVMRFAS